MIRNEFIAILGPLVQPRDPAQATAALRRMLPMLSGFPDEVFCGECAQFVSSKCLKGLPCHGELKAFMTEWWEGEQLRRKWSNRPKLTAPEPPDYSRDNAPKSEAEKEAISHMVQAFKAERLFLKSHNPQGGEAELKTKPLPISDGQLLAQYEKLAAQGDACAQTRAAMLRRKLGVQAHA